MGMKDRAFKLLLEVALDALAKAIHASGHIASDEDWIRMDEACFRADIFTYEALKCVPDGFEDEEKKLYATLKRIANLRIRAWENWQWLWREQQAITDPTGRYAVMKAEREVLTAMLKDGDDDGDGHHSPKQ